MTTLLAGGNVVSFLFALLCSAPAISAATGGFPPVNPFLAASVWPMLHGNTYNQGSSELAGPVPGYPGGKPIINIDAIAGDPVSITIALSGVYPDGRTLAWGNTKSYVYKMQVTDGGMRLLEKFQRRNSSVAEISGAYALTDRDSRFIVPRDLWLDIYTNATVDDPDSPVMEESVNVGAQLSDVAPDERIVGLNMTYDGFLAVATNRCRLAVISRQGILQAQLMLGSDDCEISNSIAVDESGGIFVVTSRNLQRIDWQNPDLRFVWSVDYSSEVFFAPGRLGSGSGTSPTLMGSCNDQDKFVVLTDGRKAMNLLLVWRGYIPDDWQGIPGKDRRIAAEIPVTFGKRGVKQAITEQSLVVMGYAALAVDNSYGYVGRLAEGIARRRGHDLNKATIYLSNTRGVAPYGIEKFEWNPETRSMSPSWARSDISCPNGVPVASAQSNLVYCVGQRRAVWNIEALDWSTGRSAFQIPLSKSTFYNSFYAGLQIGPFSNLMSGTFGGFVNIRKDLPQQPYHTEDNRHNDAPAHSASRARYAIFD